MASVIYLTDTRYGQQAWQHPSARHRCYHYADSLLSHGCNSVVFPMERVSIALLKGFDHAVFHRPSQNSRFKHALQCCNAVGLKLHADYDDLIFHPDFAQYSPQHLSSGKSVSRIKRQFTDTYNAAKSFASFLVSTVYLADKMIHVFPNVSVTVLPNSLPRTFTAPCQKNINKEKLTIGYFPGSRGHSADFKSVIPALSAVESEVVRILIVGRMNEEDYAGLKNVKHLPFALYADYLKLLSHVDVSIAPLLNNEFNQSKSAVKLIESVSVGTPIVATENRDMADHNNDLSYLVGKGCQWQDALRDALEKSLAKRNDIQTIGELQKRFSVTSRLPILLEHLQCAA